ncbi:MAG: hypothetical protein F8N36_15870 [Desulfovibrio sp.]|nr:hypothetical protein [Desulfovibrio sp.]
MNLNSNFLCQQKDFIRDASKMRSFCFRQYSGSKQHEKVQAACGNLGDHLQYLYELEMCFLQAHTTKYINFTNGYHLRLHANNKRVGC